MVRPFTSRPDTPISVAEHFDLSSADKPNKQKGADTGVDPEGRDQPGKNRPMAPPEQLREEGERVMPDQDNVNAEGARVMGGAGLMEARTAPQVRPRGAAAGVLAGEADAAAGRPTGSFAPTGPGFSGSPSALAGTDGISSEAMTSEGATQDTELMKGRLREMQGGGGDGAEGEGEGEGGSGPGQAGGTPPDIRHRQTPMSP
ncbi:hypothetical protein GPECTOR_46g212 [Gonium pectorale]|uniref:Uncharacterized protein n=1 Tax=Gonium pectorale TaxID=33097 RepID=A0A150G8Q3_GONPE|nr:hypothetical protein GPECTOR_46g212 [Gonium pectorale]|eukprot:KXZ46143.1 hypothetical protein GPECTOR_46g212 [Gonium pectorale]